MTSVPDPEPEKGGRGKIGAIKEAKRLGGFNVCPAPGTRKLSATVRLRLVMSVPRCSLRRRSGARQPRHARARQSALRVAPGGSAPLIPSVARRGSGGARSGRESRLADRTGKPDEVDRSSTGRPCTSVFRQPMSGAAFPATPGSPCLLPVIAGIPGAMRGRDLAWPMRQCWRVAFG
jgi:hypothetical protein